MQGNAWSALAELAASQHGLFHKDQAADKRIAAQPLRRAVASGALVRPLSDVFTFRAAPQTWEQRLMIVTLAGGLVSHRAAARLHGLDGFETNTVVDASFARGSHREFPDAVVHRWRHGDPTDITRVDGFRCTSIARTLVQLGLVASRNQVEEALDSALRAGASARWIEDTLTRLWRPGPTGAGVLASIISGRTRVSALPESLFERRVERILREGGLAAPELQYEVALESGTCRLDLAYPDVKLGIEAHSRRFHFGPAREEVDNQRDLELAAAGWELVYVTWGMLQEPEYLVRVVAAIRAQRVGQLRAS